jgi:hypothetical protein
MGWRSCVLAIPPPAFEKLALHIFGRRMPI